MNKAKGFYIQNKKTIMLTASILVGIFVVVAIVAIIINGGTNSLEGQTNIISASTKDKDVQITKETKEDESVAMQEETTTDEEATEPETVNPDTLPYKIMINRAANCITIYGKDQEGEFTVPVKAITCSTGREVGDTPLGSFNTLVAYDWLFMVDGSYGQYAYRFYGPILFHSVPYYSKDKTDLEWEQYNKLGEPASLGCVRVTVADAIWLIDNCAIGTYVEVYDDAANPGPLGKPETIKIPENSPYRGWDPTDPDENNPWHQFKPVINIKNKSVIVYEGSTAAQLLSALGAVGYDTCGNNVTSRISLSQVDLSEAGTYDSVKLNLTDAINKTADQIIVQVTVKKNNTTTTEATTPRPTTPRPTTESPTTTPETATTTTQEAATPEETEEDQEATTFGEEGGTD